MIDIGYYRKIQNAHGANSLRDAQIQQIKSDLNRDFNKPLDCESVLIDGVEHDLTIIEANNLDEKKIKSRPNDSFHSGQIVYWAGWYWIITKVNRRSEIVSNGEMKEYTYDLYWQDNTGKIIDKWAYTSNASSYSNGTTGNATITLTANQFLVVMPKDDDTINLEETRMIIDNRTNNRPTPYKLTRPDNVTADYGIGCTYYIFTLDQRNDDKDKKVTLEDASVVWICDYITPTTPTEPTTPDSGDENLDKSPNCCKIEYKSLKVKIGGSARTYVGSYYDENGNLSNDIGEWIITSDFNNKITTVIDGNTIKISISEDYPELDMETFTLQYRNTHSGFTTSISITIEML